MASYSRRRVQAGDVPHKFSWCYGPDGMVFQHQPVGPDGATPVEPLDKDGKRIPGFCPGSFVSSSDTKLWKRGTRVYCQCSCHGPDQPEAWPGYAVQREAEGYVVLDDDGDDDAVDAAGPVADEWVEADLAPVVHEHPPVGQSDAGDDEVLEDGPEPLVASSDVTLEVETKRIRYATGEVARVEVPGLGRGGKPVTNVNWVAYDKSGARLGREWSLTSAKKLLP